VPAAEAVLARSFRSPSPAVQNAAWETARYFDLPALIHRARADALAPTLPPARRAVAVRALRGSQFATAAPIVRKVLEGHPPPELQVAVVDTLSAFEDPAVGPTLLEMWKGFSPEARRRTITALLEHRQRVPLLLKAMEVGQIEAAALDLDERARLVGHPDQAISAKARILFHSDHSERSRVLAAYQDSLKLQGRVEPGKQVFEENCARCHTPRRAGGRVGPDLSGINNKTREELLQSILDPSSAIEARYVNYMVTTSDGRMYDGVIAAETPGAVTLRGGSEDGDQTILRRHIAEIRASSVSLMPEGLEQSMSKQDIADVIAYLRGGL
jgi:putative heme-binding domain-containing protein